MDESSIIEQIRGGKNEVLGTVYTEYRTDFSHWLIKHYGSEKDDALEVYQETIIAFYENIANDKLIELNSSLKTYIFSIGKNKYLSMSRKNGRNVNSDRHLQVITDDPGDPEDLKRQDNQLNLLERSLERLTAHCRELLKLYYYDKLNMEQIMERLDYKNANTAKNQKYKCMQQLRKFYSEDAP